MIEVKKLPKNEMAVSTPLRNLVYARDDYTCYRCGIEVDKGIKRGKKRLATLDHFLPQRYGGMSTYHNLRTCCDRCNLNKGCTIPKIFKINIIYAVVASIYIGVIDD